MCHLDIVAGFFFELYGDRLDLHSFPTRRSSERAGPNTLVATVLAKDPDGDGIGYSITDGNTEGNFVIDSQKGTTKLLVTTQTLSDLPSNQRVSP